MSRPVAFVLAGGLAAGKSTLASELERRGAAAVVVAFGRYVREEAAARGLPADRAGLQELGRELVSDPSGFVAAFLRWAGADVEGRPVIIEGLRHREVGQELRMRMSRHRVVIVYLEVPTEVRRARYVHRGGSAGDFDRFDANAVEAERHDVRAMADLVLSGEDPLAELASRVIAAVDDQTVGT